MLRFLQDSDYEDQVRNEIRTLLDSTPDMRKLRRAEEKAIAQMKMYLCSRYDVEQIFHIPQEGEADRRNAFIVMSLIDIVLYHLWSKERGKDVPQIRNDRYQDALDWLKSVGNGEELSDLPAKLPEEVSGGVQIYSPYPPSDNRY